MSQFARLVAPWRRSSLWLLCLAIACGGGDVAPADSSTLSADDGTTATSRIASDATLTLVASSIELGLLREVIDQFARREAVRVQIDSTVDPMADARSAVPDLIVLDTSVWAARPDTAALPWILPFAGDRVVLAYTDSSRFAASIDTLNWSATLKRRGVRVRRADSTWQLTDSARFATDSLITLLQAKGADYLWLRESTAKLAGLRTLPVAPDSSITRDIARDIAITIPRRAQNGALAERFLRFLISAEGTALLRNAGVSLPVRFIIRGTSVPSAVAVLVDSIEPTPTARSPIAP